MGQRVAAVVVLFHPPESVVDNIASYLPDVERLYIVDNSPDVRNAAAAISGATGKIVRVSTGCNAGIAAALNRAAQMAGAEGFDFLLTMDQDSTASAGMIAELLELAAAFPRAGIVSPFQRVRNLDSTAPSSRSESVLVAMTSGNLLRLTAYTAVGPFLDKLFIDSVDIEYCLRMHTKGWDVVQANRAVLMHRVGHLEARTLLGMDMHPSHHSPIRFYYQTRNRFYLRRLYGKEFPDFFREDRVLYWRMVLKMLLFEKEKMQKLGMIIRGFRALRKDDFSIRVA